jgi:hypothetical protein
VSPSPTVFAVENSRNDGCDLEHALDHEHHVGTAGVVLVEHQRAGVLQAPRQDAFAEFGDLLAVLQHDGILADQVDAADVAVEVHTDARPVEPRRHLLDVGRFAGAVVALDHRPTVEREARNNREGRLAVELVRSVDVGYMLGAYRERRHEHVGVDLECLPRRHLGVRHIDRGGRANFGQSGNLVHRMGGSCVVGEKCNPGSRRRKGQRVTPLVPRWAQASGGSAARHRLG